MFDHPAFPISTESARRKHRRHSLLVIALLMVLLLTVAACAGGADSATPNSGATQGTVGQSNPGAGGQFGTPFESANLQTDYENALPATMQLLLGSLALEDSDHALTPDQAKRLLPLWQALQSGSITSATERNAVYKSIEASMDEAQLDEIVAMALTFADMTEWANVNGIEMPQGGQFAPRGPNGANGGNNPFAALTDEQRAELRNLSPEERQAKLREYGIEIPEGGFGGGANGGQNRGQAGAGGSNGAQGQRGGRFNVLMTPLIELLTARAAETN